MFKMRIAIASDHRGFRLKGKLIEYLGKEGFSVIDFGTYSPESCDYPDLIYPAALALKKRKVERAILICYTGVGSCIVANRLKGVRAALVYSLKMAELSRKHNNSNALVLPAGFMNFEYAKRVVKKWLGTEFEGGRHSRRLGKIKKIEERENV